MYCIIMAGGSGTRFWPASRKERPKQFLNITGKGPMLLETCERLRPLAREEEMILVIGREHLNEARRIFEGWRVHIIAEPAGRNTAACIGLGALYAEHLGSAGPMAFLPADHFIADPGSFVEAVRSAGQLAASGAIVTLGIVPTRPEIGYGYIRRDREAAGVPGGHGYGVSAFVEKPDLEKARQYLARGDYYWNAGIFVAGAETILKEMHMHLPGLYNGLNRLRKALDNNTFETELEEVYSNLENISFDYGIMERTSSTILVVPCECGWSDVGSWSSLYELRKGDYDSDGNLAEGSTLLIDCKGNFVSGRGGRFVACLGLKGCLIVDTPEALLVADLKRSQDIRKIIEHVKRDGKEDLL